MMTSAAFADSIMGGWAGVNVPGLFGALPLPQLQIQLIFSPGVFKFFFAWMDMTLTSSIGVSLAFNGLSSPFTSDLAWRLTRIVRRSGQVGWKTRRRPGV